MVEKALELYRKYREMILYLVFGGLTTLVNIFSYFVLTDVGEDGSTKYYRDAEDTHYVPKRCLKELVLEAK